MRENISQSPVTGCQALWKALSTRREEIQMRSPMAEESRHESEECRAYVAPRIEKSQQLAEVTGATRPSNQDPAAP